VDTAQAIFCPQTTITPVAEARRFTRRSLGLIVVWAKRTLSSWSSQTLRVW